MLVMLRRKRLVRLHLASDERSFEGVLVGFEAGHYRLVNAKMLETAERTFELGEIWVQRERVLLVQTVVSVQAAR